MGAGIEIGDWFSTWKGTEVQKNKHCLRTGRGPIIYISVLQIWDAKSLRHILIQSRE